MTVLPRTCANAVLEMQPGASSRAQILGLTEDTRHNLNVLGMLSDRSESGVFGVRKTSNSNSYFVRHPKRGYVGTFPSKEEAAMALIAIVRDLGDNSEHATHDESVFLRPAVWEQRLRACALNPDLRAYVSKSGGSTTANLTMKIRKYYVEYEADVLDILFAGTPWQVDHIIPSHLAGPASDLLENMVLMEERANKHFGAHLHKMDEKRAFVGEHVFKFAQSSVYHEQKRPRIA